MTSDDQEIQQLLHEVLVNFGQMLRGAEGELQSSHQDPKRQELGLERVQSAHVFMDRLEEFFVADELTLQTPEQLDLLRSLTVGTAQALASAQILEQSQWLETHLGQGFRWQEIPSRQQTCAG